MYMGVSSSCSRKKFESKSSKVKDKHAESAQQQLLSGFNDDDLYQFCALQNGETG